MWKGTYNGVTDDFLKGDSLLMRDILYLISYTRVLTVEWFERSTHDTDETDHSIRYGTEFNHVVILCEKYPSKAECDDRTDNEQRRYLL